MIARKNNNAIEITFAFDPALVSFVKSLEGRKYLPHKKAWYIPLAGSFESVQRLAKRGFTIDPELWVEVRKDQELSREAEALAVLPDTEFDTPLANVILYSFQRVVSAFMVKTGSCLNACGVGTGKTIMTLAVVAKTRSEKNLVICPKSLMYQWESECNRVLPDYKVFIVIGNAIQRKMIYKQASEFLKPYFLIMSYEVARIDNEVIKNI